MKLAQRLDRLRGAAGGRAGVGDGAMLQRLDRVRGRAADPVGALDALARALGAEAVAPGLLRVETRVRLDGGPGGRVDLDGLPEAAPRAGAKVRHRDWVYVDIETTGLSGGVGNVAFVVGIARLLDDVRLQVRQYLMATFSGESALLEALCGSIGPSTTLASYNGKCFDVPVLQARTRLRGLTFDWALPEHVDLLFPVRRAYRRYWPDCRLATAERRLLNVHRVDDLPGAEAPAAWHAWLRRGQAGGLQGVLRHNLQDLVSLALLHRALVRDHGPGAPAGHRDGVDYRAIGQAWLAAGFVERAEQVWCAAGDRLDDDGQLAFAALYRRRGAWGLAERIWLTLHAKGDARAASALSKYYEHRQRDYVRAMRYAADCEPVERAARTARLARKLAQGPSLPLSAVGHRSVQKAMK